MAGGQWGCSRAGWSHVCGGICYKRVPSVAGILLVALILSAHFDGQEGVSKALSESMLSYGNLDDSSESGCLMR